MLTGLRRLNSQATWPLGLLLVAIGCGPDATAPSGGGPISLSVISGSGQSGVVGTELPQPLVIKATDSKGVVQGGLSVNFRVTSGGGSMYAGTAATDSKGIAEDYWTLGTSTAQTQRVEVRAVLSSGQKQVYGVFSATALPGPDAQLAISAGNQQTAHPLSSVPIAPGLRVTDQYGNPVPNVTVTFTPAAGSGSVSSGTPTTLANGTATVGSWTLGSNCGSTNTLVAMASGNGIAGNPAAFSAKTADCWIARRSMPTARNDDAIGVNNGILYAVGGNNYFQGGIQATVEAYDPATDTWTTKASMSTARDYPGVGVINGILYAVGGYNFESGVLATVEAYDPATDRWTTKASMPTARYGLAVGVVNGILYAVGGQNGSGPSGVFSAVEAYDPSTNTWTTTASMSTPRTNLAVGVINGILYAVGGDDGSGSLSTVEAYDPSTNTWTTKASMSTPRNALNAGVVNGILYAVGGYNADNGWFSLVEAYDPSADTWTTKASMPTARTELGVGVVNGVLYAVGGSNPTSPATGGYLSTVEAYHP